MLSEKQITSIIITESLVFILYFPKQKAWQSLFWFPHFYKKICLLSKSFCFLVAADTLLKLTVKKGKNNYAGMLFPYFLPNIFHLGQSQDIYLFINI